MLRVLHRCYAPLRCCLVCEYHAESCVHQTAEGNSLSVSSFGKPV